jgi:hypothetical protein
MVRGIKNIDRAGRDDQEKRAKHEGNKKEERVSNDQLISFLSDVNRKISENTSLIGLFMDSIPIFDEKNIKYIPKFIENLLRIPKIRIREGRKMSPPPHIALKVYQFCLELIQLIYSRNELIQNSKYRDLLRSLPRNITFIKKLIAEEKRGIDSLRQQSLDILNQNIQKVMIPNKKEFPIIEDVKSFFKNYIERNIELPPGINLNDNDFSAIYNLTIKFLTSEDIKDSYSYDLLYAIAEAIRKRLEVREKLGIKTSSNIIFDEELKNEESEYEIVPLYDSDKSGKKIKIVKKNKE